MPAESVVISSVLFLVLVIGVSFFVVFLCKFWNWGFLISLIFLKNQIFVSFIFTYFRFFFFKSLCHSLTFLSSEMSCSSFYFCRIFSLDVELWVDSSSPEHIMPCPSGFHGFQEEIIVKALFFSQSFADFFFVLSFWISFMRCVGISFLGVDFFR